MPSQVPPPRVPAMGMPNAQFLQQQQQQQQQQQYRNQNPLMTKRVPQPQPNNKLRQNMPVPEELEEPSGDELDDISARDIAVARYKRNHDYLSEIFTPYKAEHIVPPPLEIQQSKEELEKLIQEHDQKLVEQEKLHQEKLSKFQKEHEQFIQSMNQLNQASTLESIEQASDFIAKEMNVQIEQRMEQVKIVPIPGIKEDAGKEQEEKQVVDQDNNMDIYFDERTEENDFFNDMVNTDDDPTVSEFINTD
ncbi:hypothetical protein G6F22_006116 [Rhizopus arrhizus]|nr:hypothetical protein G6F22_006116 [Rhizopus arrhizus]